MKLKERMKYWGFTGALIGGVLGFSLGYKFIYLPAIGSAMIVGLIIGWMFTGFAGVLIGGWLSALGVGFYNHGISPDKFVPTVTIPDFNKFGVNTHNAVHK
jgi:hypothetical protein